MDPLSVAASVAGLVNLSLDVSRSVGSYCKAVKHARKDVQETVQELTAMQGILHQLEELLRSQQMRTRSFNQSSLLATTLELCRDSIKRISPKAQNLERDGVNRVWEKLKWPFSEKEMLKTLATLRRCAATFQFSLTIEGCNVLSQSSEDASKSLELQLKTAKRVLELTQDVATMAESAKEASKVSNQVSEILELVNDHSATVHAVQSLSRDFDMLALRSQEHDKFHDWMNGTNSTLLCIGGPGVGKSVLTTLVIDHVLENHLSTNEAIVYFYFDYRDSEVQTPGYCLASLLRQLAARKKSLPQSVLDFYDRFKDDQAQDLIAELSEAFQSMCQAYERCFIMIDALDECRNQGNRKEIVRLLKTLPTSRTKIFVTSRPHPHDINQYFEDALRISVEASEADIKHYCSRMIDESVNATDLMDDSLKQQVVDSLASKAHGMFLLPVLQLQIVLEALTKSEIKAFLSNLSASLGQAFENTIQRIEKEPPSRRQAASQALMWVSHARRPLLVDELRCALATELGDRDFNRDNLLSLRSILEICFGLIVLEDESSTVRLVHYTLQDYLRSRRPQSFIQAETYITQVLITYLCLENGESPAVKRKQPSNGEFQIDFGLLEDSPFLQYAASNWGHHAKLSPQPSEINGHALALLENPSKLTRATQRQRYSLNDGVKHIRHCDPLESHIRRKRTALHIVAGFGLVGLLGLLLDRGHDITARDNYEYTALHDAAVHGQIDALELLIEHGADVHAENSNFNTPLFLAVSFSHEQMIPALLKHGAHVNDRCRDDWSPLHKAADNGHLAIAQRLLDYGASVTARSGRELIPLHRAAGRGHAQMVQLLLDHGSPVDEMTWDGWTPLHGASSSGQEDVIKILLDHHADIDKQSRDDRTALHRACRGGHSGTVSTLLMKNANPWIRDCGANLPIHRAAKGGDERVCRLLLQQDSVSPVAQLSALNDLDRTPEKEASSSGHWKLAALLRKEMSLRTGTIVVERGGLEVAIAEGLLARVLELLSAGVDVDTPNSDSSTPLHQALLLGNESIARVLLEHNANVTAATSDGWQALHCAAHQGMASMVRLCLDRKADVTARTLIGQSALHQGCKSGDMETVRLLLDAGANVEARDDWGWRPLHTASAAGHQEIVELLIAQNAHLEARALDGRTVQACAAMAGKHALVEFLRQARSSTLDWYEITK